MYTTSAAAENSSKLYSAIDCLSYGYALLSDDIYMQVLRGKGKLYNNSSAFLDSVAYIIHIISEDKSGVVKWRGEITPDNGVMPVGKHILELEDGRKGSCSASMKTNSSFGLVVDSFNIEGLERLEG